jgi:hypothetical protein
MTLLSFMSAGGVIISWEGGNMQVPRVHMHQRMQGVQDQACMHPAVVGSGSQIWLLGKG